MSYTLSKDKSGFTLVEVLVSTLIIAVLILGIFSLILYSLKITADNKFRLAATMIANQKMEYARNLPYNSVGTTAGIVQGVIPDNETVNQNNGVFYVNTLVQYVDDAFDGVEDGDPDDLLPTDYKSIRIRVSWDGPFGRKNVAVFTNIAPRGMETSAGGGTLSVFVFDANGLPVEQANAHIENNNISPAINFDAETNSSGKLSFPGAPESVEYYKITVSKTGYSVSSTTDRTVDNPNPTKPHATVLEGQKTEVSFAIDLLSDLTIKTVTANLPQNWQINNDATEESQINSRLTIDNSGFIYVAWQDFRQSANAKIYAQKYDSGGNAQWPNTSAPDDIVISAADNQVLPDILTDNSGNLFICWNDDSNGNQDVYLVKRDSADGSDLWGGAKKVDTAADPKDQTNARIALLQLSGNAATSIVWTDNRNTDFDIYLQLYDNNRNQLWTPEIRVNTNTISDGTNQYDSEITADSSDNIYIVWTDNRNGNLDVYAQKYDTNGNNLWSADLLINTDNGSADQYSPSAAVDSSDNIYVVWTDERDGNQDVYAQKYDAAGNNLWSADVRVNINTGASAQYNPAVTINPATNRPFASWEDDRNGDLDIYAAEFDNYDAKTSVASVPITVIGAKRVGEDPIIYKYSQSFTSNASGEVVLNNIEWDSYSIELQAGYTDYVIVMSDPVRPIDLTPNSSETETLYLE